MMMHQILIAFSMVLCAHVATGFPVEELDVESANMGSQEESEENDFYCVPYQFYISIPFHNTPDVLFEVDDPPTLNVDVEDLLPFQQTEHGAVVSLPIDWESLRRQPEFSDNSGNSFSAPVTDNTYYCLPYDVYLSLSGHRFPQIVAEVDSLPPGSPTTANLHPFYVTKYGVILKLPIHLTS